MRKYVAKRATARWTEKAPAYVLAVFDNPNFSDRYTIIFGGKMQEGDGTYAGTWLHYLSTNESGSVSGSDSFKAWEAANFRRAFKRHQIRWLDLPEKTRILARVWACTDNSNHIPDVVRQLIIAEEKAATAS